MKKIKTAGIYVFVFLAMYLITRGFPLTSDDLYFKNTIPIGDLPQTVQAIVAYGNGRYTAYLLEVFLVHHPLARHLFAAAVLTLLMWIFHRVFCAGRMELKVLSFAAILFPSPRIYAQVYVWTVGFLVYVLPVITVILLIRFLFGGAYAAEMEKTTGSDDQTESSAQTETADQTKTAVQKKITAQTTSAVHTKSGALKTFGMMLMVFVTAFCNEIAAVMLCAIPFFGVLKAIREKKRAGAAVAVLLTGGIGAFLMLLLSKFLHTKLAEGYRDVPASAGGILQSIAENSSKAGLYLSAMCFLWLLILAGVLLIEREQQVSNMDAFYPTLLLKFTGGCAALLAGLGLLQLIGMDVTYDPRTLIVYRLANLLQLFVIFSMAWICRKRNRLAALLYCFALISLVPLYVVSPISPRVFYLTYMLLLAAAVSTLGKVMPRISRSILQAGTIAAAGLCAGLILISVQWKFVGDMRDTYVNRVLTEGAVQDVLRLPALPDAHLLQADHDPNFWKYELNGIMGRDPEEPLPFAVEFMDWYNWIQVK